MSRWWSDPCTRVTEWRDGEALRHHMRREDDAEED